MANVRYMKERLRDVSKQRANIRIMSASSAFVEASWTVTQWMMFSQWGDLDSDNLNSDLIGYARVHRFKFW